MLRAYFGHHKCASTWIWEICNQVCREAGLVHKLVLDPQTPSAAGPLTDHRKTFDRSELELVLQREKIDFVSCITADIEQAQALSGYKGVHVVRDPRDIIVSAYFSHRNSHPVDDLPHMAAHREQLRRVSKEEGLFLEMAFSKKELEDLALWDYRMPHVLEIRMEDLTASPYEGFLEIFEFLDLISPNSKTQMRDKARYFVQSSLNRLSRRLPLFAPLRKKIRVSGAVVLEYVHDNRFEKKAKGRKVGEENSQSHYRKGQSGDWINHFTADHVLYFKEQYGELLTRMGYEKDLHWHLESAQV